MPGALLALAACRQSLEDARAAWDRDRPDAYVFEYQRNCSCPGSGAWWRITVREDSVVSAELLDSLNADRRLGSSLAAHPTVDQLFDGIATFGTHPHTWTKARFDSRWHFPTHASGDVTNIYNRHWDVVIRNFQPIK